MWCSDQKAACRRGMNDHCDQHYSHFTGDHLGKKRTHKRTKKEGFNHKTKQHISEEFTRSPSFVLYSWWQGPVDCFGCPQFCPPPKLPYSYTFGNGLLLLMCPLPLATTIQYQREVSSPNFGECPLPSFRDALFDIIAA